MAIVSLAQHPRPLETTTSGKRRRPRRRPASLSRQERLAVKREKNRVAASKCREKKLKWEKDLSSRARTLQNSNMELQLTLDSLKDEQLYLKGQIVKFWLNNGGCVCGKDMVGEVAAGLFLSTMTTSGTSGDGRRRESWGTLSNGGSNSDVECSAASSEVGDALGNVEDLWNQFLC
jgi:hypothetical protein